MIPLFVTIDTEGDSLWDNPRIEEITTENVLYIPRFQELCEKYGFVPIWLVDYEIACDDRFIEYIKEKNQKGLCEVGIHVHARNNPPLIELEDETIGAAYLIEYPDNLMREKFEILKTLLEKKLDCSIITHRAGRWALDSRYVDLLIQQGIEFDCSVTPGLNWTSCAGITQNGHGSDYTKFHYGRQRLQGNSGSVIEYPVSVFHCDSFVIPNKLTPKNILRSAYYYLKRTPIWLRPNANDNLNEMKSILSSIKKNDLGYAEFMIHSSEFMPGAGPHHEDVDAVETIFHNIEELFKYARHLGYGGYTFHTWERHNDR